MASRSAAGLIGACALLLGLAMLSWLAIEQHRNVDLPTAATTTRPIGATTASTRRSSPAFAPSAAPAPAAAEAQVLQVGDIEVCGFGVVRGGNSDASRELERVANTGSKRPMQAHLARMRQSADARTRAAALMAERDHAALVEMAVRSSDPTVYAFALHSCQWRGPDGSRPPACQLVSHAQAARLDADNGAVWLHIAAEAHARQDSDGVAAALHRATAATTVKQRQFDFASLALAALPPSLPPAERTSTLVALIGLQAALGALPYRATTAYCARSLMADANRRQTCDAVAELLVGKGHSLIDFAIGRRIGEAAGWPRERVELLAARSEASMHAFNDALSAAPGGMVGCAAFQLAEQWHHDIALRGERAAAEALLARAGVNEAEMLSSYRRRAANRAAAQASTAAASTATDVSPAPSSDRSPAALMR